MKTKIVIDSPEAKRRGHAILEALALDPPSEISIKPYVKDMSAEQRKLYFVWVGIIADSIGYTKLELHHEYKRKWLIPIFERDKPEWAEMIQSIRDVWKQGMKETSQSIHRQIVNLAHLRDANVKQMSELMDEVSNAANDLGIRLPFPDV